MHCEEDSHQGVHRDNHALIVKITFTLHGINTDEKDREHVVNNTMVHRANTTLERAEGEELLCGPDLVDSVRILDFFLLDSMLVILSRYLVSVNVSEQLYVVEHGHKVGATQDSLDCPVLNASILLASYECDCVTLGPEFARRGP